MDMGTCLYAHPGISFKVRYVEFRVFCFKLLFERKDLTASELETRNHEPGTRNEEPGTFIKVEECEFKLWLWERPNHARTRNQEPGTLIQEPETMD
jgi:hypothetical protein